MTCPIDSRPLTNNATICATCEGNLARALGDLDALLDDLDTDLTRQSRNRPLVGINVAQDGKPLPFFERASKAERELYMLLKDIVGSLAIELSKAGGFVQLPMPPTSKSLSSWLLNHVHWIATHEPGAETYAEIIAAVNDIRRVIDIAPGKRYVGPCMSVTDDVECREILYALEDSPTVRCRTCGNEWDIAERLGHFLPQADHVAQTAVTISRALTLGGLPLETSRIRKWAQRKHLVPAGTGPRGAPTYIVAHVSRLINLYETGQKLSPWEQQEQETA